MTIVIFRSGVILVVRPGDRLFRRHFGGVRIYHDGIDAKLNIRPAAAKGQMIIQVTIVGPRKRWQQQRMGVVTTEVLPAWTEKYLYR